MTRAHRSLFVLFFLGIAPHLSSAQVTTGIPPFGSFGGGPDVINLANLNSHLSIPVLNKPGRGMNFTYDLSYGPVWHDSSDWRDCFRQRRPMSQRQPGTFEHHRHS